MSENKRGQNKEGQREDQNKTTGGRPDLAKTDLGSKEQISTNRGLTDMDAGPSIGTKVHTRGSGISTKKNVTGSDYDGQVSDE